MSGLRKRLLLIEPPFRRLFKKSYSLDRMPLGPAYLAAWVRQQTDWEACVYNADFAGPSGELEITYLSTEGFDNYRRQLDDPEAPIWREVEARVAAFRPGVVGVPAKSQSFASAARVAAIVKRLDPDVPVIVGGPHPSSVGAEVLERPWFDAAVQGEGEETLVEMLRCLEAGESWAGIPGTICRRGDNIVTGPRRAPIADLDLLPHPHRSAETFLLDYPRYPKSAFRYLFATRGCPFECQFCGSREIWGRRVRFRSPANVVAEIRSLRSIGLRFVHFSDDTFGVDKRYLLELCEAIRSDRAGISWSCEIHPRLVNAETATAMRGSGCHSVEIGIESGSDEILRELRKQTTVAQALAACSTLRRRGIEVVGLFMAGLPQETEESLQKTLEVMRRAPCDRMHFSVFTPYPGTEAFELCREMGLIDERYDPALVGHQSPVNHFCPRIPRERFRGLVAEMGRLVDRRNRLGRARRLLSAHGVRQARELGLRDSFLKLSQSFLGR